MNCLGMFDHLVGPGLRRLKVMYIALIILFKLVHMYFFKLGFTPCKAEQPLQGMELQEKEIQKD